jgi:amidase
MHRAADRSVLDGAIVFDVMQGAATDGEAPGQFARAARESPPCLRVAVCEAFPAGTRGTLLPDVRQALHGTAELLRSLGHHVVERDIDFRVRDNPVILGLMFRAIRNLV